MLPERRRLSERRRRFPYLLLFILAVACCVGPSAQRPVRGQQDAAVYYVSLAGDDANPGTQQQPWRHIEWAMTRPFLRGGDVIRVRGGVYRPIAETVFSRDSSTDDTLIRPVATGEPGRPISVMAEPGERVTLSGRFPANDWTTLGGDSTLYYYDYSTPLSFPFDHPFQVTEDGRLLYRVSSLDRLDRPGRCYVDTALRRIYIWTADGRPPAAHEMEYGGSSLGIEFRGGVRHWRLRGLRLIGFRSYGVVVQDRAGSIELDQLDIGYIGAHRPDADLTNGYAIATYDTSGGNFIHDCDLHHTLAESVHVSQSGAGGDIYEDNTIHDAGGPEWLTDATPNRQFGPGFILRGNRTAVRGNRIHNNGYHGLIIESDLRGSEGAAAPAENIIERNVFAFNGGNGIHCDGKNGAAPSRGNTIGFNLFDRNNQARAGSSGDGEMRIGGNFDDALFYNNTIYAEKANGILVQAGRESAGTAQGADAFADGLRLFNNIIVFAGQALRLYPLRVVDPGTGLAADYNNWFRPLGGAPASWNGADLATLDDFRARTGLERRGLSLDPRFVSPENSYFWLRAVSPVIGRGFADALAGAPGGPPPDLGAFPYQALLTTSSAELRFATVSGTRNPAPQALEIRSGAGKPLGWTARTSGESWIVIAPAAGFAPSSVGVAVRADGLGGGTYSAAIQITPALDGEPPLTVRVGLTVLPSPARRR